MKHIKISALALTAAALFSMTCAGTDYSDPASVTKTGVSATSGGYAIDFSYFPTGVKPLVVVSNSTNNLTTASSRLSLPTINTVGQGALSFQLSNPNYDPTVATGTGSQNFKSSIEAVVSCQTAGTGETTGRVIALLNIIKGDTLTGSGLTTVAASGGGLDCNNGRAILTAYLDGDNDGYIDTPDAANTDFLWTSSTIGGGASAATLFTSVDAACSLNKTSNLTGGDVNSAAACAYGAQATAFSFASYFDPQAGAIAGFTATNEYTVKVLTTYTAAGAGSTYAIEVYVDGTLQHSRTFSMAVFVDKLKNSTTTPFGVVMAGTGTPANAFVVAIAKGNTTSTSPYIKSIKIGRS